MPDCRAPRTAALRVALSTIGTFHTFDMARQLEDAGVLATVYTGYPRFKLGDRGIPQHKIRCFPWLQGPYMAGFIPGFLRREWEHWSAASFGTYVAADLPDCDIFCGLSGSALRAGRLAQRRGARYVCDRGSAHIRFQDAILREEHDRWGLTYGGIDARAIDREEAEYDQADAILTPSRFAQRTFIELGIPAAKLRLAPYGVDLARFAPAGLPRAEGFDCLFVGALSVRKGAGYLLRAFEALVHPRKSLTVAGSVSLEVRPMLQRFADRSAGLLHILGHVPYDKLRAVMSRAHVLVLPSIEDGFGLVQAQAMACGCPVVASTHTGAEDLFTDGVEGLIVPARDSAALASALQRLADDPSRREGMAQAALRRVRALGGWEGYGQIVLRHFRELAAGAPARPDAGLGV